MQSSLNTQAKFNGHINLLTALKQYGLCPHDWVLHEVNKNQFLIQNKEDQSFTFWGKTKNQKDNWEFIQLKSI